MNKQYKSYDHLEGAVTKVIRKSLGLKRGFSLDACLIAKDVWSRAANKLTLPTDRDISIGIYEFYGNTR